MNLYIIAGEKSGDYIGSRLIKALKALMPNIKVHGVGDRLMAQEGVKSLFPIEQISLIGFLEVIPRILVIRKLIKQTVADIIAQQPKILVTVDSPAFTYRVASAVRKLSPNIKLIHVVAPSVWAYKPGRAQKYAMLYDHLFTILPFEASYFTKYGLETTYIGHPILEQNFITTIDQQKTTSSRVKTIAITPGSRQGEIIRHMPIIRQALDQLSTTYNIKVVFVQSDSSYFHIIEQYLHNAKFAFTFSNERLKIFAASDCVLAKSGTNTLEIAASGTPMIIGYKLNPISFFLLRIMLKIKYACIINIMTNKQIIPEYIQGDFNVTNITIAIKKLLKQGKQNNRQLIAVKPVLQDLGLGKNTKPSEIAAQQIINMMK